MICFLGTSHAAEHLREGAKLRGNRVTDNPYLAQVVFVSEDTPTDDVGKRDMRPIKALLDQAYMTGLPIVLTSQVEPGFTRALCFRPERIYYQAETLRIKDAAERAFKPDYLAVGCSRNGLPLPATYEDYLRSFECPIHLVSYEDAEFSKIAVNMMLAAQVDATNRLSAAAEKVHASWRHVAEILKHDKRIGQEAYLTPGRWRDSKHLLRDHVTLEEICTLPDSSAKLRTFAL